jgi:hypothetical protein
VIDRLEPANGHQPCNWITGDAIPWPPLHRYTEGLVQRFLGQIEVPQQSDQRRQDAT